MLKFNVLIEKAHVILRFLGRSSAISLGLSILGSTLLATSELGVAIFIQLFLKTIGLVPDLSNSMFSEINFSIFEVCTLLVFIVSIRSIGQYLSNVSSGHSQLHLKKRLIELLAADMLLSAKNPSVKRIQSLTSDLFPKSAMFSFYFSQAFTHSLQIIALSVALIFVAWKESVLGLILISLIGCIVLKFNKKIGHISKDLPKDSDAVANSVQFVAANWLITFLLKTSIGEYRRLKSLVERQVSKELRAANYASINASVPPFLGTIALVFIIILSRQSFDTSASRLLVFLYLFIRFVQILATSTYFLSQCTALYSSFRETLWFFNDVENSFRAANLALSTEQATVERHISFSTEKLSPCKLLLSDVFFRYPDTAADVFANLNLEVAPGEHLGIVGPSGSGKSTLLSLILGLTTPTSGKILLNEAPPQIALGDQKINIGYAGPEPFLFDGTVRDNVTYGLRRSVTDEEIIETLKSINLIPHKDMGDDYLNKMLSPGARNLSTGQRQRLCFARVVLQKPSLIVLDEISANLDHETEILMANSLNKLRGKSTIIIVSHRPGILAYVDKRLYLNK